MHVFFTSISNMVYIALIYFLWRSIFKNTQTINDMRFDEVFVYLAFATSIYCLYKTDIEWKVSRKVIDGTIINNIVRPVDFQIQTLCESIGIVIGNFACITIPGIFLTTVVFNYKINIGRNVLFFVILVLFAFLISFLFDFIITVFSFYTESIWGISIAKEVVILLLSGAVIPIKLYPQVIRGVVELLPFNAMFNIPLTVLTSTTTNILDFLGLLGFQLIWFIILFFISRVFFIKALKDITINGG